MSEASTNAIERQTELALAANEELEAAARAWAAYTVAQAMFHAQQPDSPVTAEVYKPLKNRLMRDYGFAIERFQKRDAELRAEMAAHGDTVRPSSASRLGLVLYAARQLDIHEAMLQTFARHITGEASLAAMDEHGVDWLIRFLQGLGFQQENDNRPTAEAGKVTDEQLHLLRMFWQMRENGGEDSDDRRLGQWLSRTFGVSAVRFLNCTTAWAVIMRLRRDVLRKLGEQEKEGERGNRLNAFAEALVDMSGGPVEGLSLR